MEGKYSEKYHPTQPDNSDDWERENRSFFTRWRGVIPAMVLAFVFLGITLFSSWNSKEKATVANADKMIYHMVDPSASDLRIVWRDKRGYNYYNAEGIRKAFEKDGKYLAFAMNAGMYQTDGRPLGLYVENGVQKQLLNRRKNARGNFYMLPNGVFYLTKDKKGVVCKSEDYPGNANVDYATQSGPMLLIDGRMHAQFIKGSKNLNIRNGVGILPDGKVLFAMSKEEINFYDFATFFKDMGCKNALYLDGFVSRTYIPKQGYNDEKGRFGAIIVEFKDK